jgi:hypothetical protein
LTRSEFEKHLGDKNGHGHAAAQLPVAGERQIIPGKLGLPITPLFPERVIERGRLRNWICGARK